MIYENESKKEIYSKETLAHLQHLWGLLFKFISDPYIKNIFKKLSLLPLDKPCCKYGSLSPHSKEWKAKNRGIEQREAIKEIAKNTKNSVQQLEEVDAKLAATAAKIAKLKPETDVILAATEAKITATEAKITATEAKIAASEEQRKKDKKESEDRDAALEEQRQKDKKESEDRDAALEAQRQKDKKESNAQIAELLKLIKLQASAVPEVKSEPQPAPPAPVVNPPLPRDSDPINNSAPVPTTSGSVSHLSRSEASENIPASPASPASPATTGMFSHAAISPEMETKVTLSLTPL